MSTVVPFNQRFASGPSLRPIDNEMPKDARTGLISVLRMTVQRNLVPSWDTLANEAIHVGRRLPEDFSNVQSFEVCTQIVLEMRWDRVYAFFERVYRRLQAYEYYDNNEGWVLDHTLEDAQNFLTSEINELLAEENLAYEFTDGLFYRRGRPQTQKNIKRVSAVLADVRYSSVRAYYQKALSFYNSRPTIDSENCIKEAVCALEAFVEVLLGKKAAKDFDKAIQSKQGNRPDQIPPSIADGIIKIRAFRGNAQGVAHAALSGYPASEVEAELCLSLVASYITYLHDKYPQQGEEVPF